jgi:hypothetical protein
MSTTPFKLLYLPNEVTVGDQVGPRLAFQKMLAQGELAAYESLSFLVTAKESGTAASLAEIVAKVQSMQPDLLLWQHIGVFPITDAFMRRLRAACPGMKILYHEGDMFGGWAKPLPRQTAIAMRSADVVSLVGTGEFAQQVRKLGAKRVIYSPHSADTHRFGTPWTPTAMRDFDVVMIGNRVCSRLPWKRIPGAQQRSDLVAAMTEAFGDRFAVFGHGWQGCLSNHGPLPFDKQEAAVRRAWVSISWDHFDQEASYFSDRVPISLLSGVPHVTNYQPGYEAVFGPAPPLYWAESVPAMLAKVDELLSLPVGALDQVGHAAADYGRRFFHADVVYRKLLSEVVTKVLNTSSQQAAA